MQRCPGASELFALCEHCDKRRGLGSVERVAKCTSSEIGDELRGARALVDGGIAAHQVAEGVSASLVAFNASS